MIQNEESVEERLIWESELNKQDSMRNQLAQLQCQIDQQQREYH